MKENKEFENIYNASIKKTIEKFLKSNNDFFFTEKDLHFYFFHNCISKNPFEHQNRLLLHSEYPMPFRATTENNNSPIEIVKDEEGQKRRPAIDSVLLNKNFIEWLLKYRPELDRFRNEYTDDDYRNDCIRGLCIYTESFSEYINDYRETYKEFYRETKESILSHSLEFKYFKGGEGIQVPIEGIKYDLHKLSLIAKKNEIIKEINFPFSDKCALLVFIGKRGSRGIITELDKLKEDKLFQQFKREDHPENKERCVIRYDFKK